MNHSRTVLHFALVVSAVLATLSGVGWVPWHWVFKPSVMLLAIYFVATDAQFAGAGARFRTLLLISLVGSLGGDVFLMLSSDLFIPGLASFLVAHVFYILVFHQGQRWFPSKPALVLVLAVGAGMYAVVWGGLKDPVLAGAVAAYVVVISLMASQALGRALNLGTAAAWRVAAGACIFMVSDSIIAINKFVQPVPWADLWILATYFGAQLLIVHNVVERPAPNQAANANRTKPNASANA